MCGQGLSVTFPRMWLLGQLDCRGTSPENTPWDPTEGLCLEPFDGPGWGVALLQGYLYYPLSAQAYKFVGQEIVFFNKV